MKRCQERILRKSAQLERENKKLKEENCQLKEKNRMLKEKLQQLYEEKSSENQPNFETKRQPSISELPVHESFFQRVRSKPNQLQKLIKLQI
jgi:predicted RNase H-like nuclease (RuvC/YqgF family)